MRFTSGISDAANARSAAEAACRLVTTQLAGEPCDLACVFVSTIYRAEWPEFIAQIDEALHPRVLIGCSGSGIIGGEQEFEWVPAISIVGARLPEVKLFPFTVAPDELELSAAGGFWIDKIGAAPQADPIFIVFADPYTCQPSTLLQALNQTYRGRPVIGGLVSGGNEAGEHLLFSGKTVLQEGIVGVGLSGNITLETVVSQGCRPIGRPYVVTKAEDHVVWELGGRQALTVLHDVLSNLSGEDRELARQGAIVLGVVVNDRHPAFSTGDFVIRNIVGIDPDAGAIAAAEEIEVGHMLQFHVRDANLSRRDLRRRLAQMPQAPDVLPTAGGLLFNCSGRGKAFYGTSHHDLRTIQTVSGKFPIGGFFCNGEIGPIGATNFVHGYTASLGLFRPLRHSTQVPSVRVARTLAV